MKGVGSEAVTGGTEKESTPAVSPARRSLSVDGQAIVLAAVVALAIFLGIVPGVPW